MMSDESNTIKIVVIDDHEMILQSIVRLLCADPQFVVVGTALTAAKGVEICRAMRPDVIIIDYTLPDMDAPQAILKLREDVPDAKIVTLSGSERPGAFYAALRAGSSAWVRKTRAIHELRDVVLSVAQGRPVASEEMASLPPLDELVLHFQPIVDLESERLVGFEALVRWQHPHRGMLYPSSFLPLAEVSGFIIEIDKWCLQRAASQLKQWQHRFRMATPLWMSVNASVSDFSDVGLLALVSGMVAVTGLEPETLVIEITESVLLDNSDQNLKLLTQLRELGVGLALDDFGTAFSSLSYLRRFPFDHLKLDMSFIAEVLTSTRTLLLVEEICHLTKAMGMRSIAEGIEQREQADVLRSVGCEFGQGYLFSKPLPAEECEQLLVAQLKPSM
jgi:EAL domain-containing protein (putative c-di-GMP-specific phosphodiesterase class I)